MLGLCQPCKEKGKLRAIYKTIGGVPMCGGCVADQVQNTPKPSAEVLGFLAEVGEEEKEMSTSPETIKAIQEDAAAGLSLQQIAKKHGASWPTAKRYVKNGRKPAGGGDKSVSPKRAAATSVNGNFSVSLTAEGLDAVWNALPAEKKAELLSHL